MNSFFDDMEEDMNSRKAMSLSDLNFIVKSAIHEALPDTCWIRAEMTDVRVNSSSGHCYLEFVEKDEKSKQIIAKARGMIWARSFNWIRAAFEEATKQRFASGLKVLVNVSVEFHELYGYSLLVNDIDPSYTLGDLMKKRKEILRRLEEEGIINMNRELPFPMIPNRIAVVTSSTAAGYEDFIHQLINNEAGYAFYIKLFPAIMQGDKSEASIIAALDRIYNNISLFDVVVIIRGGGSTSDLNCFDSYLLAANCAQFSLPVITGIGHERDDTAVDAVAHTKMKTPTAVAAFLISRMDNEALKLQEFQEIICDGVSERLADEKTELQHIALRLPGIVSATVERQRGMINGLTAFFTSIPQSLRNKYEQIKDMPQRIARASSSFISVRSNRISDLPPRLQRAFENTYNEHIREIEFNGQYIKMVSPEYILKRGYTLTYKDGKIVKQAQELAEGDEVTVKFADGGVFAVINTRDTTKL